MRPAFEPNRDFAEKLDALVAAEDGDKRVNCRAAFHVPQRPRSKTQAQTCAGSAPTSQLTMSTAATETTELLPPATAAAQEAQKGVEDATEDFVYLSGNSCGLQPKFSTRRRVVDEHLDGSWTMAVRGSSTSLGKGNSEAQTAPGWPTLEPERHHWMQMCKLYGSVFLGCKPSEVTWMNSLTQNLHSLMSVFYRPKVVNNVGIRRTKILMDACSFHSDYWAVVSHAQNLLWRVAGLTSSSADDGGGICGGELEKLMDPEQLVVRVPFDDSRSASPSESEDRAQNPSSSSYTLSTQTILNTIEQHRDELCLILLPGVHFLTGQVLNIQGITEKAHEHGIPIGFDLAHWCGNVMPPAANHGNTDAGADAVPPSWGLHAWNVDFAVGCSYKYLNAGPGNLGLCYVHERHHRALSGVSHTSGEAPVPLRGWWGAAPRSRFAFDSENVDYQPEAGVDCLLTGNPPSLLLAALVSGLESFFLQKSDATDPDASSDAGRSRSGPLLDVSSPSAMENAEQSAELRARLAQVGDRTRLLRGYAVWLLEAEGLVSGGCVRVLGSAEEDSAADGDSGTGTTAASPCTAQLSLLVLENASGAKPGTEGSFASLSDRLVAHLESEVGGYGDDALPPVLADIRVHRDGAAGDAATATDLAEPKIILRCALCPLYIRFVDVWALVARLKMFFRG